MKNLGVTIVHSIPGRTRLRLQRPPRDVKHFIEKVSRHEGIEEIRFNPVTLSLLVRYRPSLVSSIEITVRVAISLSIEYKNRQVAIEYQQKGRSLTGIDYYAVSSLFGATLSQVIAKDAMLSTALRYNAGYSTLFAVLRHAANEVRKEGIYDPEVISVVYLINSLVKGNYLPASAITWFVTFGRHLLLPTKENCMLEATPIVDENNKEYIEVIVRPTLDNELDNNPLKLLVVILGRMIGLNVGTHYHSIMEQIEQMARKHGNVLEGMNKKPGPVYLRLTQ